MILAFCDINSALLVFSVAYGRDCQRQRICILVGRVINQFGGYVFGGPAFTFRKLESKIISSSEIF